MSAYVVSRQHVWYLLESAMSTKITPAWTKRGFTWYYKTSKFIEKGNIRYISQIGQMLWDANIKSVQHRYPEETIKTLPGTYERQSLKYIHIDRKHSVDIVPIQVIKACHCYGYQSCECDSWEQSEAKTFIDALIEAAIMNLDGYEEAAWGPPKDCPVFA